MTRQHKYFMPEQMSAVTTSHSPTETPNDLYLAALEQFQAGYDADALQKLTRLLHQNREHLPALNLLAWLLLEQGKLPQAQGILQQAISLSPECWYLHHTHSVILEKIGKDTAAAEANARAKDLHLQQPVVLSLPDPSKRTFGFKTLIDDARREERVGNLTVAEKQYLQALERAPNESGIMTALAMNIAAQQRQADAAIWFERAVACEPKQSQACQFYGMHLLNQHQWEKAEPQFREAIQRDEANTDAWYGLYHCLHAQQKSSEAEHCLHTLQKRGTPENLLNFSRASQAPLVWQSTTQIHEWRKQVLNNIRQAPSINIAVHIPQLTRVPLIPPMTMLCHQENNLEIRKTFADKITSSYMTYFPKPREASRFHVGFYVEPQREGLFLRILGCMLKYWQAEDLKVSILCQSQSKLMLERTIANPAINFVLLPADIKSHIDTARAARLDLLHYWECGTTNYNYLMPSIRLAPTQSTGWGAVETTGIKHMDLFISSGLQEPDNAQTYYSEQLITLPSLPFVTPKPTLHGTPKTRREFGFSDNEPLLLCAQHIWKIHPDMDELFKQCLESIPNARLALISSHSEAQKSQLMERLEKNLGSLAKQVRILPYMEYVDYLSLMRCADAVLDTCYYGGGQSTLDALAMGAPVVTLPGNFLRGRSTLACYRAMRWETLIAKTADDFAEKVKQLATDHTFKAQCQKEIMSKHDILFMNKATIVEHQQAMRDAIIHYRQTTWGMS